MLNYTALYFVQFAVPKYIKGTNDIENNNTENS